MTTTLPLQKSKSLSYYFLLIILCAWSASSATSSGCAGEGSTQVLCNAPATAIILSDLLTGETSGGTWSMNAYGFGGTFDENSGTYTPDASSNGVFHFYYSFDNSECGTLSSKVTLVFVNGDTSDQGQGYSCQGDVQMFNLNEGISHTVAGQQQGGIWARTEGTGGNFDAATGMFDCTAEATNSTFTYTVQSGCGTHSCTFNVYRAMRPVPGAGSDGQISICQGTETTVNLFEVISGEEIYNPTWTRVSGEGGIFDPENGTFTVTEGATTSVFKYRMASGAGMCGNDSSYATVTIDGCENANQGCNIQYWKSNPAKWSAAYVPNATIASIFSSAPNSIKSKTLMQVLSLKAGGGPTNLARQGIAALLNTTSDDISYPTTFGNSAAELIATVNHAFQNPSVMNSLADGLQSQNELICPMSASTIRTVSPVTAFPMPFKQAFSLKFDYVEATNVKIEIFNSLGKLVMTKDFAYTPNVAEIIQMNPEFAVQPGSLYLVRTTTASGSSVQKIFASNQ